jgi:hypothetical protein
MISKNKQTVVNSNIEHAVKGKKGNALLIRKENGDRIALIKLSSGKNLTVTGDRINLRAMKSESVADALNKVCHGTGRISLYDVETFHGPKAVTTIYSSQDDSGETGYGLFLKRGKKALTFALNRLDLEAMNVHTVTEAARKATYTGRIAIANA